MESSSTSVVAAVVVERKKRQQRSMAEKRRIVEETLVPGASVALVARSNGVNANLVFAWLRLYHAGRLIKRSKTIQLNAACLLPVKVSEGGHRSEMVAAVAATKAAQVLCAKSIDAPSGAIHIHFPKAQVRVEGSADASMLRVVLECLIR